MHKIGVLLMVVVNIFGFTNADKEPNCNKFPSAMDLYKCCYQVGKTPFGVALDNCLEKYTNKPHPEYCATNCAFEKSGIGNPDGSINFTAYHKYLAEQAKDNVLVDYMMKIVRDCETHVNEMIQDHQYNTDASKPCSPRAHLIVQCSAANGILNCPVQKWKKGSMYCSQILENTKFCKKSS